MDQFSSISFSQLLTLVSTLALPGPQTLTNLLLQHLQLCPSSVLSPSPRQPWGGRGDHRHLCDFSYSFSALVIPGPWCSEFFHFVVPLPAWDFSFLQAGKLPPPISAHHCPAQWSDPCPADHSHVETHRQTLYSQLRVTSTGISEASVPRGTLQGCLSLPHAHQSHLPLLSTCTSRLIVVRVASPTPHPPK